MISVCIPTFNGERYLTKQLDSILVQLEPTDEVIISDDSSTDDTVHIIEDYQDKRIKLYKNNTFKSPIFNLENALSKAKGDFIFLADQDDIWMNNKVEVILREIEGYDVIVSDCTLINENEIQIADSFFNINKSKKGLINNFVKNSYLGCCMAFNQNILNSILPFPKGIAMHDIWIGLVAEVIGKPKFISDKLVMYRRHGENLSTSSEKSKFSLYFKIKYRVKFIYYILCRILVRAQRKK